jgi:Zn-dependent M28 family amino/carboxypeptidase
MPHYDTVRGTPGADDNASGVAGLLELAPALSSGIPQTRIDLVAYVLGRVHTIARIFC